MLYIIDIFIYTVVAEKGKGRAKFSNVRRCLFCNTFTFNRNTNYLVTKEIRHF